MADLVLGHGRRREGGAARAKVDDEGEEPRAGAGAADGREAHLGGDRGVAAAGRADRGARVVELRTSAAGERRRGGALVEALEGLAERLDTAGDEVELGRHRVPVGEGRREGRRDVAGVRADRQVARDDDEAAVRRRPGGFRASSPGTGVAGVVMVVLHEAGQGEPGGQHIDDRRRDQARPAPPRAGGFGDRV